MTKARDIASAIPAPSTVDATELGYLDGVTSAIQTQLDAKTAKSTLTTTGDIYYASAANTPARLAIGSTSNVLTVAGGIPSWAAPASGGMTLLSTTALTGSSVVLSSISGSYTNLYLVIKNVYLATSSNCYLRLNNDSGNNYSFSYIRYRDTTVGVGSSYSDTLHGYLFEAPATNTVSKLANCEVVLPRYTDTDTQPIYTRSYGSNATQNVNYTSVGSYDNSAAITQIDIIPGANFSGGTAYLYGVK